MATETWDIEVDIIAVGFGAAGSAVAIAATDAGAEVLLVEKQPHETHTPSTRLSGGQILGVTDVEAASRYMDRCAGGMTPVAVTRAWAEQANRVIDWFQEATQLELIKAVEAEHREWSGSEAVAGYGAKIAYGPDAGDPRPRGGAVLFGALERAVLGRDLVKVVYDNRAQRLLTDETGRVVGVQASTPEGMRRYRARCGVVLTCGGFEHDEEMRRTFLRSAPTYFYATPANTGDGIRMLQDVRADLWHMSLVVGHAVGHFDTDDHSYTFAMRLYGDAYVLLDKYGRRFINEELNTTRHDFIHELTGFDSVRNEYPRVPVYWVFDQGRFSRQPLSPSGSKPASGPFSYQWSEGYKDEIERGWIKVHDTLEGLFAQTSVVDGGTAIRTIAEYNEACRSGKDTFGRPPTTLLPLDNPPYYCVELWPGGSNTSGGGRRNEHAQVIDIFGNPIPGLYEAGELGEAVGFQYPANGANISDALCFGQIAVAHALLQ